MHRWTQPGREAYVADTCALIWFEGLGEKHRMTGSWFQATKCYWPSWVLPTIQSPPLCLPRCLICCSYLETDGPIPLPMPGPVWGGVQDMVGTDLFLVYPIEQPCERELYTPLRSWARRMLGKAFCHSLPYVLQCTVLIQSHILFISQRLFKISIHWGIPFVFSRAGMDF